MANGLRKVFIREDEEGRPIERVQTAGPSIAGIRQQGQVTTPGGQVSPQGLQEAIAKLSQPRFTTETIQQTPEFKAQQALIQQQADLASQTALERLGARGLATSTLAPEAVAEIAQRAQIQQQALIPELLRTQQAQQQQELANLVNLYNLQRQATADERLLQKESQEKQLDDALRRVEILGVVDAQASQILGVPEGSLSADSRKKIETEKAQIRADKRLLERQKDIERFRTQLKTEQARQKEIEEAKKPTLTPELRVELKADAISEATKLFGKPETKEERAKVTEMANKLYFQKLAEFTQPEDIAERAQPLIEGAQPVVDLASQFLRPLGQAFAGRFLPGAGAQPEVEPTVTPAVEAPTVETAPLTDEELADLLTRQEG